MMKYIVFASFLLALAAAKQIQFKGCASEQDVTMPATVDITPCDTFPCTFKSGMKADVKITFVAPENETALTAAIFGVIAGIKVPFQMPNPDGCKESGITCPITKGATYTYHSTFDVLPSYPAIQVIVEWRLDGVGSTSKKNDFCFTFPIKIVTP